MLEDLSKVFFVPGDIVKVRHKQLKNIPLMYVVEKVTRSYKHNEETVNSFKGIKCRWFNVQGDLCEAVFSSKDLEKVK